MISERLRYSLYLEKSYMDLDPECDNIRVYFPFFESCKSIYYISRFGNSVIRLRKFVMSINSCKLRANICPAMLKKNRPAYLLFSVHGVCFLIHKVIAMLFLDNVNVFATEVDHKDGNMYYNNAFNLEWVTHEENIRRRYFAYYTNHNKPVPEKYKNYSNYMSYLNSKNYASYFN